MVDRNPRFGEVVRAIKIYSGLDPKTIRERIESARDKGYSYRSRIMRAMAYGHYKFGVPYHWIPEICKANRRLTEQEIENLECDEARRKKPPENLLPLSWSEIGAVYGD